MSSCKKSEAERELPPDKIKLTPLAQRDLEVIYLYGLQHFNEIMRLARLELTVLTDRQNTIKSDRLLWASSGRQPLLVILMKYD
ncbi:hypothetical protein PEC302107_03840 [Pectobacterium araliae]|uniref:hypothetical protein n=1 Tax=Pectobacterium araliae TaxID=3073862 RepID=UPI0020875B23|nr:hypothetical protein PEC302107_03840 [Pectobacterium carotovorum subsp. carotovorum]